MPTPPIPAVGSRSAPAAPPAPAEEGAETDGNLFVASDDEPVFVDTCGEDDHLGIVPVKEADDAQKEPAEIDTRRGGLVKHPLGSRCRLRTVGVVDAGPAGGEARGGDLRRSASGEHSPRASPSSSSQHSLDFGDAASMAGSAACGSSGFAPEFFSHNACREDRFEVLLREIADLRNREFAELQLLRRKVSFNCGTSKTSALSRPSGASTGAWRRPEAQVFESDGNAGLESHGTAKTIYITQASASKMTGVGGDDDEDACVGQQMCRTITQSRGRKFELMPAWVEENLQEDDDFDRGGTQVTSPSLVLMPSFFSEENLSLGEQGFREKKKTFLSRFITYPSSPRQLVWDCLGLALITYDMMWIPIAIAFSPPGYMITDIFDTVSLVYWTLNVPATLSVGCVVDGETLMHPAAILKHYFRTWFALDAVTVLPDWYAAIAVMAGTATIGGAAQASTYLGLMRLLRLVRLLRLLKIKKLLQNLQDMVESEHVGVILSIVKMLLLLLCVNHVICCLWWMIGKSSNGKTWIKKYRLGGASWWEQYVQSYHWSITQFTPASMGISPQNLLERVFAIVVIVSALVFFSYIVGSITGSLSQIRTMREEEFKQFWQLRRFLRQHRVRLVLSCRILRYAEGQWKRTLTALPMQSVKLISLLSDQLMNELKWELCADELGRHPLFAELRGAYHLTLHRLSDKAVKRKNAARHDVVFMAGERAHSMCVCAFGRLCYEKPGNKIETLDNHQGWISEPALWTTTWFHLGSMRAFSASEILEVESRAFAEVIAMDPKAYILTSHYAREFIGWLNTVGRDEVSDVHYTFAASRAAGFLPRHQSGRKSRRWSLESMQ